MNDILSFRFAVYSNLSGLFSDTNCIYLVAEGVHEKMLDLLESSNSYGEKNPSLQHAVFSSLRNLSIPGKHKSSTNVTAL